MLPICVKNYLVRRVCEFEASRSSSNMGRKRKLNTVQILDRIFFVCQTGCQWSCLPVKNASFKTVYHYFAIWSKARLFEDAFYTCVREKQFKGGSLVIDTSFVKNVHGKDVVGKNPTDRGRKATKVSLLCDGYGTPLCSVLHKANSIRFKNEIKLLTAFVNE